MGKLKFLQHLSITIRGQVLRVIPVFPGIRSIHTISTNPPQILLPIINLKHHIILIPINHKSTLMAKEVISRISRRGIRKVTMGSHNTSNKGQVIRPGHLLHIIKQVDTKIHQIMSFIMLRARCMPFLQARQGLESKCWPNSSLLIQTLNIIVPNRIILPIQA